MRRIIISMITFITMLFTPIGIANAHPEEQYQSAPEINQILEKETKILLKFVKLGPDKVARFDENLAKKYKLDQHYLDLGRLFNQFSYSRNNRIGFNEPGYETNGIPVYGNWCGPGYGKGSPVDRLDIACMHHDKCYERVGYLKCSCDQDLIDEIDRNYYRMAQGKERNVASAIRTYFIIQKAWCRW